jgi:putative transposase
MGRHLRIFIPGYSYHVIVRGNERKNIFRQDVDRKKFLEIFGDACEKFELVVYSYVLMSNHYHFLIKINKPNLASAMQYVNSRYAIYFNLRYKRTGHLIGEKYKAIIVEHGQDLQFVTAYIHLNPARAGMVEKLIEYPWSSHRQYTGGLSTGAAQIDDVLGLFGKNRSDAIKEYEKYILEVAMCVEVDAKKRIYGDYVMGSEGFVRDVKLMFENIELPQDILRRVKLKELYDKFDIIKAAADYFKLGESELMFKKGKWNKGKAVLMYLLNRDSGMTCSAIGKMLGGLYASGVSRICTAIRKETLKKGSKINRVVKMIKNNYRKGNRIAV